MQHQLVRLKKLEDDTILVEVYEIMPEFCAVSLWQAVWGIAEKFDYAL